MANLAATFAAIEKYCGFSAARCRTVAERLLEAKLLEPGAPGVAVVIGPADFALLLLALASGAPLRSVADRTVELCNCVPNGIDVDVMPANLRPAKRDAFDTLLDVLNGATTFGTVGVCETWPEVTFSAKDGVARFQPPGSLSGLWQRTKQRRSTSIPAGAIALAAQNLFGEK